MCPPSHLSAQQTFSMQTHSPKTSENWTNLMRKYRTLCQHVHSHFSSNIVNKVSAKFQHAIPTQKRSQSYSYFECLWHSHKSVFPLVGNCRQKLAITGVKTSAPCNLNCRYDSLCYLYCRLRPFRGYQVGDT